MNFPRECGLSEPRGGYFDDRYTDTGISTTTNVTYQTSAIGISGVPAELSCQLAPSIHPARRSPIRHHEAQFLELNYNQLHRCRRPTRSRPATATSTWPTTWTPRIRAGSGPLLGSAFTSGVPGVGAGTGTYGYYSVTDRGTSGRPAPTSTPCSCRILERTPHLTLNLGVRTEQEADSIVSVGYRCVRILLWGEACSSPGGHLRRSRRWPAEDIRQLGPLLRLDEVRVTTRFLRRRILAGLLPLARYTRRQHAQPDQQARAGPVNPSVPTVSRSARAELRRHRPGHPADVSGQHQRGDGVPVQHHVRNRRALDSQ